MAESEVKSVAVSLLVVAAVALSFPAGNGVAAEIYQWRDAGGRVHYVDNPAKVPPEYRDDSRRSVRALKSLSATQGSTGLTRARGALKWEELCASCHDIGDVSSSGKLSLDDVLVDKVSRLPVGIEQAVFELRRAADGHYSDMDRIDVSDDELRSIAEYLIKEYQ